MPLSYPLPIIDVSTWWSSTADDNARAAVAEQLVSAFERVGMAYLHFPGPSARLLHQYTSPSFLAAQTFFRRPLSNKQTASPPALPPGVTRGYLAVGAESGADQFELKEAFSWSCDWMCRPGEPHETLEARNVWPRGEGDGKVHLREPLDALFTFFCSVMLALAEALELAWPGNEEGPPELRAMCVGGEPISLVRAFHYHRRPAPTSMTGSCAHTDWGFATLIAQQEDSDAALQVYVEGAWIDVPPRPDTLLVNCSDFLSLLSDGRLKSPLHRVVLTPRERLSFVFFQYPPFDISLPSLSDAGIARTTGLSLLKNQHATSTTSPPTSAHTGSFGELIARKWQQVSRI